MTLTTNPRAQTTDPSDAKALFTGLSVREFDLFALPDFETRMPAIRAEITPRLKALGMMIAPSLSEITQREIHPHVAQHLRRTVNPPIETWVAFSPSPRAYKPFTHFRVAINGEGLKIVCHLEEDSEEKPTFADGLKRNAAALAKHLAHHPQIRILVPRGTLGEPASSPAADAAPLAALADRLATVKAQDASFSIAIDRGDPITTSRGKLIAAALDGMRLLLPFYRLGSAAEP